MRSHQNRKTAEVGFPREARGSNLRRIPSPKSERVTRKRIPTTSLLTACSAPPFVRDRHARYYATLANKSGEKGFKRPGLSETVRAVIRLVSSREWSPEEIREAFSEPPESRGGKNRFSKDRFTLSSSGCGGSGPPELGAVISFWLRV